MTPSSHDQKPRPAERLSRERIVDAAFRAWGRSHFAGTSISLVARELNVTKPAIYRYFDGKEDLMQALRMDYAERLQQEVVGPLVQQEERFNPSSIEPAVRVYVTVVFSFFENNPFHYAFYVRYLLGRPFEKRPGFRDIIAEPLTFRYIESTAAYWTTEHYRRDPATGCTYLGAEFTPESMALAPRRRTETIDRIVARLVRGFLPSDHPQIDREQVERTAWFMPEEMQAPDRVFSAIEEVVEEQGYGGATVERIAERVGITKSSLYHYFRNRDDMLMKLVLRDQQHFASLARLRLHQIREPVMQLYAFFVMIASYATQHSAFMTVETWIRENDVTVELPAEHIEEVEQIFSFLVEMVMSTGITDEPGEAFSIIGFIRFLILQELNLLERPVDRERSIETGRMLFDLVTRGLEGTISPVELPRPPARKNTEEESTL
jgi:AcrR family transcriptional regulator